MKLSIRTPRVNVPGNLSFWKQVFMMILGTTISLSLTLGVAALMESKQRQKDRKTSH